MDLRAITGYIALALIAGYWVWVLSCTTPELRRGTRDRELRLKILLVKTAALVLTAVTVATIHFWATQVWHVLVAVPVAAAVGFWLRRVYRRLVAAPRHRLPLGQRIRRTGHLHVIDPPHARHHVHRVVATSNVPAPRIPPGQIPTVGPITPVAPVESAPTAPTARITPNLTEQAGAT